MEDSKRRWQAPVAGFPPSLRGPDYQNCLVKGQQRDGRDIRHFDEIRLNCDINSTPEQGYNFRQTSFL
jgi:hypothetical protein